MTLFTQGKRWNGVFTETGHFYRKVMRFLMGQVQNIYNGNLVQLFTTPLRIRLLLRHTYDGSLVKLLTTPLRISLLSRHTCTRVK